MIFQHRKLMAACIMILFGAVNVYSQDTTKDVKKDRVKQAKLEASKIPIEVREAYLKEYPQTTNISWYGYPMHGNNPYWYEFDDPYLYSNQYPENYSVEFTKGNTAYKAIYNKKGKKIATHKNMDSAIPKAVSLAISNGPYKDWKIGKDKEEIFKDKEDDHLKVYKILVEKGNAKHALYFGTNGEILKDKIVS